MVAASLEVNDRTYPALQHPAVAICIDGCEPAYLDAAIAAGLMPNLVRIRNKGTDRIAHSVIPSFTNPNNLSIATGRPPAVHGICGNYLYDPETGEEVMMNDIRFLRAPTIFKAYQDAGAQVAIVTAKDKLRALLGAGLELAKDAEDLKGAICFSSEKADQTSQQEHGIADAAAWLGMAVPEVYSAELSAFVFAAGVRLMQQRRPDLMYLTTTDYIQHKHAPGSDGANAFYAMIDGYIGQLDDLGARMIITADHGMKPKHDAAGSPVVVYLQEYLDQWLGEGTTRVILPITDPYVVHHGALGSYATAYLPQSVDRQAVADRIAALAGIMTVLDREAAVARFELPADRIGDLVIISDEEVTIGTTESGHDLSQLGEPLRSHGGLTEQEVPFICNVPLPLPSAPELRNFDAFFYATRAAALE